MSELPTAEEISSWCPHLIEPEGCIYCAPRFQEKDVRDGVCPDHDGASTWHIVNDDGSSECAACGHVHPFEPGVLTGRQET